MGGRRTLLAIVLFSSLCGSGCSGWTSKDGWGPKNTFDCLDRGCYLPDWTNCHSCISECWREDGYNFHWRCPHDSPCRPPQYVNQ
jgi:hypothetical protein